VMPQRLSKEKCIELTPPYSVNANVGRFGISRDPEIAVLMQAMLRAAGAARRSSIGAALRAVSLI
jgi:hypothetical protein